MKRLRSASWIDPIDRDGERRLWERGVGLRFSSVGELYRVLLRAGSRWLVSNRGCIRLYLKQGYLIRFYLTFRFVSSME